MSQPSKKTRIFWVSLIVLVCLVALATPFYNRMEPSVAGIPFFYWFQFVWIVVGAVVTALAYKARI